MTEEITVPVPICLLTRSELRADGLRNDGTCPHCKKYGRHCEVSFHPDGFSQQQDNFLTPPPTIAKEKRSYANQDSFRKKLQRRNKLDHREDLCDLCNYPGYGRLEAAHIFALEYRDYYENEFEADISLPISLNDANNGLLLCSNCHTHFDSNVNLTNGTEHRAIEIMLCGKINLYGDLKKKNYCQLHGKMVPWSSKIGTKDYPMPSLLSVALKYPVDKEKRTRELQFDSEDGDELQITKKKPKTKTKKTD